MCFLPNFRMYGLTGSLMWRLTGVWSFLPYYWFFFLVRAREKGPTKNHQVISRNLVFRKLTLHYYRKYPKLKLKSLERPTLPNAQDRFQLPFHMCLAWSTINPFWLQLLILVTRPSYPYSWWFNFMSTLNHQVKRVGHGFQALATGPNRVFMAD